MLIYKHGKQTVHNETYSENCGPFKGVEDCGKSKGPNGTMITDFTVSFKECCGGFCPPQKVCAKPNKNLCKVPLNSKGEDPFVDMLWTEPPNYLCVYDMDKIDTVKQMKVIKPPSTSVVHFCSQPSTNCPSGKHCSRLMDLGDEGEYCRLLPEDLKQVVKDNYCLNHPYNDDCKCINRHLYTDYIDLKQSHFINDYCWYKPCLNAFNLKKEKAKYCPSNMCTIIMDLHNNMDVFVENNELNCGQDTPHKDTTEIFLSLFMGILFLINYMV